MKISNSSITKRKGREPRAAGSVICAVQSVSGPPNVCAVKGVAIAGVQHRSPLPGQRRADQREVRLSHIHLDVAIPELAAVGIVEGNVVPDSGGRNVRLVGEFVERQFRAGSGTAWLRGAAADQMGSFPNCVT